MQHDNVTALQILGAEVEFIPAGYTSILQAMDEGLHKPFKQYLREESLSWMVWFTVIAAAHGPRGLTPY
jgi:tryptophan synthase beta subunit